MKKYFVSLMFFGLLVVPGVSFAQTANNQALIESLLKQIAQLQSVLIQLLNNKQVQATSPISQPVLDEWHRVQYDAFGVSLYLPKDWKSTLDDIGAAGGYIANIGPVLSTYSGESEYLKCSKRNNTSGPNAPSYIPVALNGRTYCLATISDAATGHLGKTYSYTTRVTNQVADRYITAKFTIVADNDSRSDAIFTKVQDLLNKIMASAVYTDITTSTPGGVDVTKVGQSAIVQLNSSDTQDDAGEYQVDFTVTAHGDDIYIPLTALRADSSNAGISYQIETVVDDIGTTRVISQGSTTHVLTTLSDGSTIGGSTIGNFIRIREGETARLRLVVVYDPVATGLYRVHMNTLTFSTAIDGPFTGFALAPTSRWRTDSIQIENGPDKASKLSNVTAVSPLGGSKITQATNLTGVTWKTEGEVSSVDVLVCIQGGSCFYAYKNITNTGSVNNVRVGTNIPVGRKVFVRVQKAGTSSVSAVSRVFEVIAPTTTTQTSNVYFGVQKILDDLTTSLMKE